VKKIGRAGKVIVIVYWC